MHGNTTYAIPAARLPIPEGPPVPRPPSSLLEDPDRMAAFRRVVAVEAGRMAAGLPPLGAALAATELAGLAAG